MKDLSKKLDLPASPGKVEIAGGFATLMYERTIAHPPEVIWAALTDPAQLRHWFMATVSKFDGRPGGSIEMVAGPAQISSTGHILTWDPPKVLEYELNMPARAELPRGEESVVRWELSRAGSSTLLRLTHRRLTTRTAMGLAPGWHAFLDRLVAQLDEVPLPDWSGRFGEVRAAYAAATPGC